MRKRRLTGKRLTTICASPRSFTATPEEETNLSGEAAGTQCFTQISILFLFLCFADSAPLGRIHPLPFGLPPSPREHVLTGTLNG